MAWLMLGYAQPGGIAEIEQAAPELVLLLGADEMRGRPLQGRVQGLYRPSRRRRRQAGGPGAARARLMPRSTAPRSTPKGGCSAASERRSRRARRARTGRSCARSASSPAATLPFDTFRPAARGDGRGIPAARPRRADRPANGRRPSSTPRRTGPIRYPIGDFFLTNAICRASPTMRRCSEELVHGVKFKEAAE